MKRKYVISAIIIAVGFIMTATGIALMAVCDMFVCGAAVMAAGLALFVPVCPICQKLAGRDSVFADARTAAVFLFGIVLLAAFGTGIALGLCHYEAADNLHLGGALLAGFSAALLIINSLIYDCLKKKTD